MRRAAKPQPKRLKPRMDTNGHELLNRRERRWPQRTQSGKPQPNAFNHRLRAGGADTPIDTDFLATKRRERAQNLGLKFPRSLRVIWAIAVREPHKGKGYCGLRAGVANAESGGDKSERSQGSASGAAINFPANSTLLLTGLLALAAWRHKKR
jgi:hypothetical protein